MQIARYCLPLAAAMLALGAATIAPASPPQVAASQPDGLSGTWKGMLLQKEWSFRFTIADGKPTGQYMPPGGVKWHPLSVVETSGQSVTFAMESKPKLSFAMELDSAKPLMTGDVTIQGVATVPFSATRATQ